MRAKREINCIHAATAMCLKILRLDNGKQHTTQPSKYGSCKNVPNKCSNSTYTTKCANKNGNVQHIPSTMKLTMSNPTDNSHRTPSKITSITQMRCTNPTCIIHVYEDMWMPVGWLTISVDWSFYMLKTNEHSIDLNSRNHIHRYLRISTTLDKVIAN